MRPAALTVALGALLLLAAAVFDAEPLYVPGVAFALVGLFAVAWVTIGAAGLVAEREVGARTVVEDQPVDVRVRVRAGLTPLPTGVVDDPLLGAPVALALGQRAMALRIRATFTRRGRRVLAPVRIVVRDPLGLAARTLTVDGGGEVLVLPRVHPVRSPGGGGDSGVLSPRSQRARIAAEVELDGVRPHRPGSPASRIQWSVLARTGELWERKLVADADARPLVLLDPRTAGAAEPQAALDAAVRAAASLTLALARQGGCSLLLPGDRHATVVEPSLGAWPRAHVRLALIADTDAAPSLAGIASRAGPVFYVAARALASPPRVLQAGAGATRILVVPGEQPGRRALFTVAGCTGYTLRDDRREVA